MFLKSGNIYFRVKNALTYNVYICIFTPWVDWGALCTISFCIISPTVGVRVSSIRYRTPFRPVYYKVYIFSLYDRFLVRVDVFVEDSDRL